MATQTQTKRLFDYIQSLDGSFDYRGLSVFNNAGPNAGENQHYICFLQCGICFEIHKEKVNENDWSYYVDIHWQGLFNATDSIDILAALLMLKHEIPH